MGNQRSLTVTCIQMCPDVHIEVERTACVQHRVELLALQDGIERTVLGDVLHDGEFQVALVAGVLEEVLDVGRFGFLSDRAHDGVPFLDEMFRDMDGDEAVRPGEEDGAFGSGAMDQAATRE